MAKIMTKKDPETKADAKKDKKLGIKEGSKKDEKMDTAKPKKKKPKTASVMPPIAKMMGRGIGKY